MKEMEEKEYTILIENLKGRITEDGIKKIIQLLLEETKKTSSSTISAEDCAERADNMDTGNTLIIPNQLDALPVKCLDRNLPIETQDGDASLSIDQSQLSAIRSKIVKKKNLLGNDCAERADDMDTGNTLIIPNQLDYETQDGNAGLSTDQSQLSPVRSKIVKKKNLLGNPDFVVINSRIREVNSDICCNPQVDGNSMYSEAAGNTKCKSVQTDGNFLSFEAADSTNCTSECPALSNNVDFVVINSKVREVKSKKWHNIQYEPQDNHLLTSVRKTLEKIDSNINTENLREDTILVPINSKIREIKHKRWFPVCYSHQLTDSSSNISRTCNSTEPALLKQKSVHDNKQKHNETRIPPAGLSGMCKKAKKRKYPDWRTDAAELREAEEI